MSDLPPGAVLILGALLVPLVRGRLRTPFLLALPVLSLAHLYTLPEGVTQHVTLFDYTLVLARIDRLALVFGLVFHVAAFLSVLFSVHVKDTVQHVAALAYAGAAIGATLAGDLATFFIFWEGTALASVFLVWASRTERSYAAGMRYLVVQVGSGVILLAGILAHLSAGGTLAWDHLGTGTLGTNLIFLAIGIKAAFPLLHTWLPGAYPEATPTGAVFLSAFTTKLAIYALARGFAGTEALVWIGCAMTVFPIVFALLADDFRRLLSYSLIIQLGFMVVGVGVGTELALNGTAAHAVAHILYKALLFMAMGAVLQQAGTAQGSRLGGLARSMPWTAAFCVVGAASIAAVPLFCGFVSKSLILAAVGEEHRTAAFLVLVAASACSLLYVSIRVPWFVFFGKDRGIRCGEAPPNMLLAMGATAALCVLLGAWPGALFRLLPFPGVTEPPYTASHVLGQAELLLLAGYAFVLLLRTGLYPVPAPGGVVDADVLDRRLLPAAVRGVVGAGRTVRDRLAGWTGGPIRGLSGGIRRLCAPAGLFGRTWTTSGTVLWVALILAALLLLYYA